VIAARFLSALTLVTFAGACVDSTATSDSSDPGTPVQLPEAAMEIAAPHQDLTAVRIMPEDGCYWYRHIGPVETTYLPLRTKEGRPICARAA
jgi:hypothetical protein